MESERQINMKTVSVIVPIYMIQDYLPECIDSIVGQTYKDLEIILVDDGSKDECPAIVDEYARRDTRIRTIHKENGGLVSARKAGVSIATGEYVLYVDGDDWIEPSLVGDLVNIIEAENADVVTSGYLNEYGKNFDAIPSGVYSTEEERNLIYRNMLSAGDFFVFGILPFLWNKIYKRELITKHQLLVDESIKVGEDVACLYALLLDARKIVVSNICGYNYRKREGSLTSSSKNTPDETEEHLRRRAVLLQTQFECFDEKYDLQKQLYRYIYFNLLMKYPEQLFTDDGREYMPYHIRKDSSVAIYGAGHIGGKLFEELCKRDFCRAIYRTDRDAYGKKGMVQVSELSVLEYDKVVIATINRFYVREIKNWLITMGIEEDKIMVIDTSDECCKKVVDEWRSK